MSSLSPFPADKSRRRNPLGAIFGATVLPTAACASVTSSQLARALESLREVGSQCEGQGFDHPSVIP
jgi:hypothetical protein